jgi:hypothetical protein
MLAYVHANVARADGRVDLAVMRATSPEIAPDVVEKLDVRLQDVLTAAQGGRDVYVAPVAYDEVQLAVGCSDESASCLTAIAHAARANAIVVRSLVQDEGGRVHLRLLYFEPATGRAPTTSEITAALDQREQLVQDIPGAVERLRWGAQAPVGEEPPARSTAQVDANRVAQPVAAHAAAPTESRVAPTTWIMLGAGAALLTPGIVLGISASNDYGDFRRTQISTRAQADRARRDFESIETRSTIASVLIPAGALAMAIGGSLLAFNLTRPNSSTNNGVKDNGEVRPFALAFDGGGAVGVQGWID